MERLELKVSLAYLHMAFLIQPLRNPNWWAIKKNLNAVSTESQNKPFMELCKSCKKCTHDLDSKKPSQVTYAGPDSLGISCFGIVPGDEAIPPTESGGVKFKNGGDVAAFGHGHQWVHHLFLGISQPASRGVLIRIHLRRKSHHVKDSVRQTLPSISCCDHRTVPGNREETIVNVGGWQEKHHSLRAATEEDNRPPVPSIFTFNLLMLQ